jgi:prepilin-type N-terminal cleavage/methylation domain-containing protein
MTPDPRGFTLLEVMIALLILGLALGALSFANAAAMNQVSRITRMTTASFLMEGIVNDTQAHYEQKGFPSNSLEDRECELPQAFRNVYSCRYDLMALNLTAADMGTILQESMSQLTAMGLGATDGAAAGIQNAPEGLLGMVPPDLMMFLQNPEMLGVCNLDIGKLMALFAQGMLGVEAIVPAIVDEVTRKTRQLTVRLSWKDGPRGRREFQVQTFIVSVPEEERESQREMDRQQNVGDALTGAGQGGNQQLTPRNKSPRFGGGNP